jgi:hypothetical protein
MSRLATGLRQSILALAMLSGGMVATSSASAQYVVTMPDTATAPSATEIVANAGRLVRGDRDACNRSNASGDIVVCGSTRREQALPVPEVYGPVRGSTDGRAVDPRGPPCGPSISNQCYEGVNLPKLVGAMVGVVQLIFDPDRNLGEGDPIPARFRGSNR